MLLLIIGLVLFLGTHSVRIYAESWRNAQIQKRGEQAWQGIFSFISIIGFLCIVWGFGDARTTSHMLWYPPAWTSYLASVLTAVAFVFFVAVYVPGTKIKAKLGHPMILGVKLWAFAHLLANGAVVHIILFGSFLAWAILDFRSSRRRDKAAGTIYIFQSYRRDAIAVVIGLVTWAVFAFYLHGVLIGVKLFA